MGDGGSKVEGLSGEGGGGGLYTVPEGGWLGPSWPGRGPPLGKRKVSRLRLTRLKRREKKHTYMHPLG